ncbi:MAG: hypothetical protein F4148_01860 [Caldilineaceae bacterium SB0675_bin_29]|uniref:Uncharacterized protein n=1 Tax=Caldilineaceae bacterium SB0675_bin_29 TaxID=2605266 RepID=A0A6B1FWV2_9CHLR|nr:hypothetical protein [Caldilineaceae bacterium SB0675_bin_29]
MRVLLALAAVLTTFADAWLTQDWFDTTLSRLPLTLGEPARVTDLLVTLAAFPFILLFDMLSLPGALVVAVFEPFCGCGIAVAAPVFVALAVRCDLTSGGLWLYRRS